MSRHYYLITIALAFSAACGSDKPKPGEGGDASAEPTARHSGRYTITVSVDDNARAQEALIEGTSVIKISAGARGGGNSRPTLKEWRADIRWKQSVHDPISPLGQAHWRFSSAEADEHGCTRVERCCGPG